jgi:hypothetical protein
VVRASGPDQQQRRLIGVRMLGAESLITIDLMSLNHVIDRRSNGELFRCWTHDPLANCRHLRPQHYALQKVGSNAPGGRRGEQENVLSYRLLIYASHTL